ncbi:hypothetical protein CPLU01_05864 [Colletotrichum plurivorum]|uniref:Uncharacterized protein n=1 Tax=Colletotrichum plurivorum TaxID=2175906 RepID=A0A8H6KKC2_9PEZI|nr:hypothetical protein CPLU01_05864 [Colletotrichum plurivorum]
MSVQTSEEISRLQEGHQTWLARVTDWTQSLPSFQQESFPHQMGTLGVSRPQPESNVPGTFGPHAGLVISEAAVPQPVSRASTRLHALPGPLFGPNAGLLTQEAAVPQPVSRSNTRLAAQFRPRPQPGPLFGPQTGAWLTSEAAAPQPVSRTSIRLSARPSHLPQPGPLFGPQMKGTLTTEAAVPQPVSGSNTRLAAWPDALFGPQTHGWFSSEAAGPQPVSQTSTHLGGQSRPRLQPGPRLLGNMTSPRPGHERTIQPPAFAVHDRPTNNHNHKDEDDEGPWGDALLDASDYQLVQPAFAVHDRPTNNHNHKDEDDEGPWGDALLDAGDYLPPSEPSTVVRPLFTTTAVQKQMRSDDDRGPVLWGTPGFNEARTIRDPYAPRDANGFLVVPPAPYPGSGGAYPGSNLPTGYPPPLPWQ